MKKVQHQGPFTPPQRHITVWIFQKHLSVCSVISLPYRLWVEFAFREWPEALPLIVSICQSIVWMRSAITDLARGQLDLSWFNWIYNMSQTQTSTDCWAMTASLLHIRESFLRCIVTLQAPRTLRGHRRGTLGYTLRRVLLFKYSPVKICIKKWRKTPQPPPRFFPDKTTKGEKRAILCRLLWMPSGFCLYVCCFQ